MSCWLRLAISVDQGCGSTKCELLGHAAPCTRLTLNRHHPVPLPAPPPTLQPLPATHSIVPALRGIDGTFTHWREAYAPRQPAHPTLSSSTTRAPGDLKNFVRGKGSYAPFLPGGLEEKDVALGEEEEGREDEEEEELEDEKGWKTRAPGMKRGVQLQGGSSQ